MAVPIQLVNLMKMPVRLRFRDLDENEVVVPPSGQELTIVKDYKTVGMAVDGKVVIMSEAPEKAIGIPDKVDKGVRYIVTAFAFDAMPDRKDFVTPARPVKDSLGIVRAYLCLRGHPKDEVCRFFKEADASRRTEP